MRTKQRRAPIWLALSLVPAAVSALGGSSTAQALEEAKVEPTPRWVDDVKTPWTPPVKLDAAPPIEALAPGSTEPARIPSDLPPELDGLSAPRFADRVLFDEPGDGALWARGGMSYKARFDTASVTYYPRFGPAAPRNYPLSLKLEQVLVGGAEIAFERDVPYQRDGSIVSYDRGSLVEYYELRHDSLEQLFHFDERVHDGDLIVRVAVETELAASSTDAGFEFANEHGRLGYSSAVVVDRDGRRESVSTTFADGRIEIRVPDELLDRSAFPLTVDPVVSTFDISLDLDEDAYNPDVAYDETTDRFTVVWEETHSGSDHDVYSVLWTSGGAAVPGSETAIDLTNDCWKNPKVANNQIADQFLVVCQTSPSCFESSVIEGRTRQADSNIRGPQFQISAGFTGSKTNPDVGGDPTDTGPTYYCVVWQRQAAATDFDIHYQLVRADSTPLNPNTQLIDNSLGTLDHAPSISKSNGHPPHFSQEWNVVWQRSFGTQDEDLQGAQIHWDGALSTASFPVESTSWNAIFPQVSSLLDGGPGPREYMVVYSRGSTSPRSIYGVALRGNTPLTPQTNLSFLDGAGFGEDHTFPCVDSDGSCFTVACSESFNGSSNDYDIYVSTYDLAVGAGELLPTESHEQLAYSSDGEFQPQITSKHSATNATPSQARRFMVVWWDHDSPGTSDGDIEGAFYDSISPVGAALCFGNGLDCPCSNPGASGAGCRNSTGAGATLQGEGTADVSVDNLQLRVTNAPPGQPGLLFQGTNALNSGDGIIFGDGLRCCGSSVIRLQVIVSNAGGAAQSTVNIAATGGVAAGDRRCYQYWYRDPVGSACGALFNLSNGYEVTWTD